MLSDYRDFKRKRLDNDIKVKDLKRTMEFSKFGKVINGYLRLLIEIIVTYSDSVCYILMLVSMMTNAGLISILYPMVVFGYALMEEVNPRKRIWYSLMVYSEVLILAKFIFQLSFWEAIFDPQ